MDKQNPEWKYDPEAEMGYLRFNDNEVFYTSHHSRVNVDLDEKRNIVGVEVFL